jgi:hypothetical protein
MNLGQKMRLCTAVTSALVSAGCGAPDLQNMKPSVWKPAALVIVVNDPASWSDQEVQSLASAQNVVTKTVTCTEASLPSVLQTEGARDTVGLVVIVRPGKPTQEMENAARQRPEERYEWIATDASSIHVPNVRQVVTDSVTTAYAIGWLAANVAVAHNAYGPAVGWLASGTNSVATVSKRSALAGAYAAASGVSMVPVQIPSNLSQPLTRFPDVVIADHPLSASEVSVLQVLHATVFSLCPQPNVSAVAAQPGFPGPDAVMKDVSAFANRRWNDGTVTATPSPLLQLNPSLIPSNVLATWRGMSRTLENHTIPVDSAWNQVPSALQQQWQTSLGLGH